MLCQGTKRTKKINLLVVIDNQLKMEDQTETSTETGPLGLDSIVETTESSPPLKNSTAETDMELNEGIETAQTTSTSELQDAPIKEEIETCPEPSEGVQDVTDFLSPQTVIKVEEQIISMSKLGMLDNGAVINKDKSTKSTDDDESDSKPKESKHSKRKRRRPLKRNRKLKITKIEDAPQDKVTEDTETSVDKEIEDTPTELSKDDVEYCLTVSNLPKSWSFMDIKNYVDTEVILHYKHRLLSILILFYFIFLKLKPATKAACEHRSTCCFGCRI